MSSRYFQSQEFLKRAEKVIPLGSQTFSKSKTQFPLGISPMFLERGQGSRVWDLDGNEYIDFIGGLLSVTMGYNHSGVNEAVISQMQKGVSFSLAHPLETEVAEKLVKLIPCAEMVRFGKNGTDATSAAIRLARAHTGRDRVAVCGYHGWQDWYIGTTTRNLGIPQSTQDMSHSFAFNDIDSLASLFDGHSGEFAAVILEPMNIDFPEEGFLQKVVDLAHENGALVIFDEVITGCRFAPGGCQELFSVTPDLATFGKGLANGFPLSAVVGRKDVMMLMEEIFFSSTFAGETASLAAANYILDQVAQGKVVEIIRESGEYLLSKLSSLIHEKGGDDFFDVKGHPAWSFFVIKPSKGLDAFAAKTFFLQEAFKHGILTLGTHNLSIAHSREDIDQLLEFYEQFIDRFLKIVPGEKIENYLEGPVLQPLFKVRSL